jgi:hypothetical protein
VKCLRVHKDDKLSRSMLDGLAERLLETFISVWEDPVRRAPVLAVLRSAIAHESAALLLRQFARRVMLARIAPSLEGPGAELRVEAALAALRPAPAREVARCRRPSKAALPRPLPILAFPSPKA